MNTKFFQLFMQQWQRFFSDSELPIAYYYTDQPRSEDKRASQNVDRCLIGNLNRVRQGFPFVYDAQTTGCSGGKRYTGFSRSLRPNFEYFLSCGIPGELEGERYKRDPELVKQYMPQPPPFNAPVPSWVFKHLELLEL